MQNVSYAESGNSMVTPKTAAQVYARRCSVCHGDDGTGARWAGASLKPPPRNFTESSLQGTLTRTHMIDSVINGRPGTAMPAFGSRIDHQILADVIDYIRTEFMGELDQTDNHASHDHAGAPTPHHDPTQINSVAGGNFYVANCATCHGVNGDGNGPRAYFINPPPVNFHQHAALGHLTRNSLFSSIKFGVRGKEMPAWGAVLSDPEILNIAEFVYLNFVQPNHVDKND